VFRHPTGFEKRQNAREGNGTRYYATASRRQSNLGGYSGCLKGGRCFKEGAISWGRGEAVTEKTGKEKDCIIAYKGRLTEGKSHWKQEILQK